MKSRTILFIVPFAALLLFFSAAAASAHYDFSNYQNPNYEDPNYYGEVYVTPYGCQIVITPPDAILYTDRPYPDERRFERRQQRVFHPGYESWSAYYESPPWHHQYDLRRNFHPYWKRF